MEPMEITYQKGLPERFRSEAAALYEEAFGQKFAVAVTSAEDRIRLIENGLIAEWAIVAMTSDRLVGIAGMNTPDGVFTGGINYPALISQLGFFRGNRAALVFKLFDRQRIKGQLLMDGITVHKDFRGQGIGSRMLDEVAAYGHDHGYRKVRLDVIDANARAKELYESKGFRSIRTEHFPYLKGIFGFGSSTTMEYVIPA